MQIGANVTVVVLGVDGGRVRLGSTPGDVTIMRGELLPDPELPDEI